MPEVTKHEPGSFCWAELATTDDGAAKKFYTTLFDWSYEDSPAGPDMIYTTLKKGDKNVGALYKLGPDQKGVPPHWNTYVNVASADETARKAKELGGKVLMEPFDVMEFGRMAIVEDQQGARICIWEPKKHIGAEVVNEPNSLCWAELDTIDTESAKRFYTSLFGWGAKGGGQAANQTEYIEWQAGGTSIGGMMKIPKEWGPVPPSWLVYFAVTDCDAAAKKAGELGRRNDRPSNGHPRRRPLLRPARPAGRRLRALQDAGRVRRRRGDAGEGRLVKSGGTWRPSPGRKRAGRDQTSGRGRIRPSLSPVRRKAQIPRKRERRTRAVASMSPRG